MQVSVIAIFIAGVLTFASPCILPLIPVYLGVLGGAVASKRSARPVVAAAAFAAGLSTVFVALGAAASAFGGVLMQHRTALLFLSGTLMVVFGLRALGVLRVGVLDRDARPGLERLRVVGGLGSAFLFGAAFALGWSPCIGPVLASVLGFVASRGTSPLQGAAYLGVYAAGISAPLIVVAAFAPTAIQLLRRFRSAIPRLEIATGALMIAVGAWTLWSARDGLLSSAQVAPVAAASHRAPSNEPTSCDGNAANGQSHLCALPNGGPVAAEVHEAAGARMLEFVSSHCPVCVRMAPVISQAERACDGFGARIQRVDVATPEGRALALRHRVVGTPTFVFVNDEGAESERIVGEETPENLRAAIESAFALRCAVLSPRPSNSG
ncbi:MAG TPA: cytochrome c biogenesis protein CcdA [Polyangiaceae bacterium]|nr:cytochrome c biogenesis protein CcdA [Polyangiaceae bacterium]